MSENNGGRRCQKDDDLFVSLYQSILRRSWFHIWNTGSANVLFPWQHLAFDHACLAFEAYGATEQDPQRHLR